MTVYDWMMRYGINGFKGKKVVIMSVKEETEVITLRRELALLKKQLEEAEMRAIAWKSMVDAIEEDMGIKVKKKPWSQALQEARQLLYPNEKDSVSSDSASSMDSVNRLDISGKHHIKRK